MIYPVRVPGAVPLSEGRTLAGPVLTVSDNLAADGFPLSHSLQAVIANLAGRRFRATWNEEVADGGEQRNEML